ncbi:hypothetical protein ACLB1Q_12370 [Escherichia coli]
MRMMALAALAQSAWRYRLCHAGEKPDHRRRVGSFSPREVK